MSLLSAAMEPFRIIDRTTTSDGYGAVKTVWRDGAVISATAGLDNSIEARLAEKEGVRSLYTIVTSRTVTLMWGDIVRRESDGKLFRITSDGTDKKTPGSTALDMRVVTAEELDGLPANDEEGQTGG